MDCEPPLPPSVASRFRGTLLLFHGRQLRLWWFIDQSSGSGSARARSVRDNFCDSRKSKNPSFFAHFPLFICVYLARYERCERRSRNTCRNIAQNHLLQSFRSSICVNWLLCYGRSLSSINIFYPCIYSVTSLNTIFALFRSFSSVSRGKGGAKEEQKRKKRFSEHRAHGTTSSSQHSHTEARVK